MCTIVFAYQQHLDYPLILAGNRDEFAARPSAPMDFWQEHPALLAGKDWQEGGTWFGVTTSGRVAALTNYREPVRQRSNVPSRGALVRDFLQSEQDAAAFLQTLAPHITRYNGFNLLLGTFAELYYFSNRISGRMETTTTLGAAAGSKTSANGFVPLASGIYGLSNHLLNTTWSKVRRAKAGLAVLLAANKITEENLLDMLLDRTPAADFELPNTGVGQTWERILSPIFVNTAGYYTRSSYVLIVEKTGRIRAAERTFAQDTQIVEERRFEFYALLKAKNGGQS